MAHPYADHAIHGLPSLVLRALRESALKLRPGIEIEKLRHLSRLVGRAHHAGHDTLAIMADYVSYVSEAIARDVDWNETTENIDALVRAFSLMSYRAPSSFDPGVGRPAAPQDLITPVEAWIAQRVAAEDCDPNVANEDIRIEMERVAALYPNVGLSYGYIGNWSTLHDDRGFMIFTKVMFADGSHGSSTRFGDHSHQELPRLRTMVLANLEGWTRTLDERVRTGRMISRGGVPTQPIAWPLAAAA